MRAVARAVRTCVSARTVLLGASTAPGRSSAKLVDAFQPIERSSPAREADRHRGGPRRSERIHTDTSSMRLYDLPRDKQAEAEPLRRVLTRPTSEGFKDRRQELRGYGLALIRDLKDDVLTFVPQLHPHRSARVAVLDRVRD